MKKRSAKKITKVINRRRFLELGSAGLMSGVLNPFMLDSSFAGLMKKRHSNIEYTHCLVLGAGLAGIAAANRLAFPLYNAAQKVIVIEGSRRLGGRIFTCPDADFGEPTEIGAQYVHRSPGSVPIWYDLNRYNVKTEKINRMKNGIIYSKGWENNLRNHWEIIKEWNLSEILTFRSKLSGYTGPDMSAANWIIKENYQGIGRDLMDIYFTGYSPGGLREMSVKGFVEDKIDQQEQEWHEYKILAGFSSLVEQMKYGLGRWSGHELDIRYSDAVTRIDSSKKARIEVTMESGKIYRAKSALITFSIGMLKSGKIEFVPPLPKEKQDALACIGMGDESKLFLEFKEEFWPQEACLINRIDQARRTGRTYFVPNYGLPNGKRRFVLAALLVGEESDNSLHMDDESLIGDVCEDLNDMFPKAGRHISDLLITDRAGHAKYLRKQWVNDKFALGADSFVRFGKEQSVPVTFARRALAYPWSTPGLFWAGEATASSTQPSGTHGAHLSGVRAAQELDFYLRFGVPKGFGDSYTKINI